MKIKIIEPVIETENTKGSLEEKQCIIRCLPKDMDFDIEYIKYGSESIETITEQSYAVPGVLEKVLKAEKEGFDGIFINCFDDPGVLAGRELVNIPVLGGFVPSMAIASTIGDNITILSTSSNNKFAANYLIKSNEYKDKICSVRFLDLAVLDLHNKEKTLYKMVEQCKKAVYEDETDVIVLGCTVMSYLVEKLRDKLIKQNCCVQIIDPKVTSLKVLSSIIELGLTNSVKNKINTNIEKIQWY